MDEFRTEIRFGRVGCILHTVFHEASGIVSCAMLTLLGKPPTQGFTNQNRLVPDRENFKNLGPWIPDRTNKYIYEHVSEVYFKLLIDHAVFDRVHT